MGMAKKIGTQGIFLAPLPDQQMNPESGGEGGHSLRTRIVYLPQFLKQRFTFVATAEKMASYYS